MAGYAWRGKEIPFREDWDEYMAANEAARRAYDEDHGALYGLAFAEKKRRARTRKRLIRGGRYEKLQHTRAAARAYHKARTQRSAPAA